MKGRRLAALDVPPLPEEAEHIWAWFQELNLARTGSGFGPNPLSHAEIDAWARLTGRAPSPAEVQALRALDVCWLAAQAKAREEAQPKGPPDATPTPPPRGPRRTPR
mgnify:CR=1 FL=1